MQIDISVPILVLDADHSLDFLGTPQEAPFQGNLRECDVWRECKELNRQKWHTSAFCRVRKEAVTQI